MIKLSQGPGGRWIASLHNESGEYAGVTSYYTNTPAEAVAEIHRLAAAKKKKLEESEMHHQRALQELQQKIAGTGGTWLTDIVVTKD